MDQTVHPSNRLQSGLTAALPLPAQPQGSTSDHPSTDLFAGDTVHD